LRVKVTQIWGSQTLGGANRAEKLPRRTPGVPRHVPRVSRFLVQYPDAALRFVESIGLPRIERWDAMLIRRLRDGLARIPRARLASPSDPRLTAAITTFGVEGIPARVLQDALWQRRIRVRARRSGPGVRLSAHLYNSPADIDAVLAVVAGTIK
jgi:selenocysteine lyase/cysteine desulfurase